MKPLPERMPSGKLVSIHSANIILFFNCSSLDELKSIQSFLKSKDTALNVSKVLIYSNLEGIGEGYASEKIIMLSHDDFNVFGCINGKLKEWLIGNKFDILISFANDHYLFCDKIISGISSDFKAGNYHHENVDLFDLTINHDTKDFSKQLDLFIHYVKNLNINA